MKKTRLVHYTKQELLHLERKEQLAAKYLNLDCFLILRTSKVNFSFFNLLISLVCNLLLLFNTGY
jgi:hypothetical protein